MNYAYIEDLARAIEIPKDGILSRTVYRDEQVNAVLFGFDTGQELSEHTASVPAIMHILQGTADLTVDGDAMVAQAGTWVHMNAGTPHSLLAKTPLVMILLMLQRQSTI